MVLGGVFRGLRRLLSTGRSAIAETSWRHDDFTAPEPPASPSGDFWDLSLRSHPESEPAPATNVLSDLDAHQAESGGDNFDAAAVQIASGDFWSEAPPAPEPDERTAPDWAWTTALPDYHAEAARPLFFLEHRPPRPEDKAEQRARWLSELLDIAEPSRRVLFQQRFAELFFLHSHAATFAALADLALEGASPEDLWRAHELRGVWAETPLWWSMRRGSRGSSPAIGARTLPWTTAFTIVRHRSEFPAEMTVDEDWFAEWYGIDYGDPLYWRFMDYAKARSLAHPESPMAGQAGVETDFFSAQAITSDGFAIIHSRSRTAHLVPLIRPIGDNCRALPP